MEYRTIQQYPAYLVSEDGQIICVKTGRPVKQAVQMIKGRPTGYLYATLVWERYSERTERWEYLDNPKRIAVHRLVAFAWLGPPPSGKPWVNHKDMTKANNHKDNLEWTSISDNIQHSFASGRKVKAGSEHWNYGKTLPRSVKMRMSDSKKGENHPKFKGWYVVNGHKYTSASAAALAVGVSSGKIMRICRKNINGAYFLDKNRVFSRSVFN
jgi:NUMOD3 motif